MKVYKAIQAVMKDLGEVGIGVEVHWRAVAVA